MSITAKRMIITPDCIRHHGSFETALAVALKEVEDAALMCNESWGERANVHVVVEVERIEVVPVDEGPKQVTLSGLPAKEGEDAPAPDMDKNVGGTHKDYWVLSHAQRGKGFVRPVRQVYTHKTCGFNTKMDINIAETYARNPKFYGQTFCVKCKGHYPVGEFVWEGTEEVVGS
ncbi:hypothetical protein LCGC14_0775370 [marine sediment metagenome]|uniref:Uncharacterized protein n=1 Tax=marine sediment metagenome TaxID=412755 RepID=A0A0F9QGW6_9ZZZZ